MAKTQSPAKPRGRPKSKSEPKVEKERSKSRGRPKSQSRGRSPTPKGAKARKPSAKRSVSRPRSRARSQTRKSEPKPRSRSSTRVSQASAKKAAAPAEKKVETPAPRVSRRTVAAREAAKGKSVVDGPRETRSTSKDFSKSNQTLQRVLDAIKNFGYVRTFIGLFWLVALPVYVLGLHLLCTKDKCYLRFDPTIPKTLRVYFDPTVIGYGFGVIALQAVLSALPIGGVVNGFGYRRAQYQYRSNGFLTLVLSFGLYLGLTKMYNLPHAQILQTHRFKCVCGATVVAFLYSLFLYLKSILFKSTFHINHGSLCSPGVQGNFVHDFIYGREVSPKIGKTFDLGLLTLRTTNFIWAVILYSALLQTRDEKGTFTSSNVLFVVVVQGIYVLLGSLNEITILKSAFINQGVGFLSVFSTLVLTPFCATLPLRYLIDGKVSDYPFWWYFNMFALFICGATMLFHTNYLKYWNARAGRKLIRNRGYAISRHPNYLGELFCIFVWTIMCGKAVLPWAHFVYVALLLVCRIRMVEKSPNAEYRNFMQEQKSKLIPYVY